MKAIYLAGLALLLSATTALAGGPVFVPNDPVVTAPADVSGDWSGPYVGLTYGRGSYSSSQTTFTEQCFKFDDEAGQRFSDTPVDCTNYVPPEGYSVERVQIPGETTTSKTDLAGEAGAFVGYRHDFGRFVGGIEANVLGDLTTAELQAGIDANNLLFYGLVGKAWIGDDSPTIYGVGADMKVGKRFLVGAKYQTSDSLNVTTIRFGIQF